MCRVFTLLSINRQGEYFFAIITDLDDEDNYKKGELLPAPALHLFQAYSGLSHSSLLISQTVFPAQRFVTFKPNSACPNSVQIASAQNLNHTNLYILGTVWSEWVPWRRGLFPRAESGVTVPIWWLCCLWRQLSVLAVPHQARFQKRKKKGKKKKKTQPCHLRSKRLC